METIKIQIINGNKYRLFLMLYLITGISVILFLEFQIFHNFIFPAVSILVLYFAPLAFEKSFQRRFVNNANFSFSEEKINIQVFDRLTNSLEKEYDAPYNQMLSFKVKDSSRDNTTSFLTLKMKNQQKYSFRIINQKEIQITKIVTDSVLSYNNSVSKEAKISLIPNFLATKAGLITVIILTILNGGLLILGLVFFDSKLLISLLSSIAIYLGIVFQRKDDLRKLKEWEQKQGGVR